jgi:hypothetical protein
MFGGPEVSYHQTHSAREWLSILRTPYTTQNLQRKRRTFLYGSENWTLTALQRRRIEAAGMKLLRPLAGYALYDHKTNDSIRRELQTECILDKIDEYRRNWLVFTLAKNATKLNPFEIISLQTTRKENNWKTEEMLARAVVTLETEQIEGPNP